MLKNMELFFFFSIDDAPAFKVAFKNDVLPLITSTTQMLNNVPTTPVNVAFSASGLSDLGISGDDLNDGDFTSGQKSAASSLGDPGTVNWEPAFTGGTIDGVFLIAGGSQADIDATLNTIKAALGSAISEVYSLQGAARPGAEAGHEHFGFLDGISNPGIDGFTSSFKAGQANVPAGEILLGEVNDFTTRPDWAKDGSFLVFRQLKQLVPEFNKFLADNPVPVPGLTPQQQSDLLGARMVGRWKSGAPIMLAPLTDDPALGADPSRNNNFTYTEPGASDQSKCPFSAHIRKTRPRGDLGGDQNSNHHIMRAGIPFGEEVTAEEASSHTTTINRGLAFVSYQSSIGSGFAFLQSAWANNPFFVRSGTGFDPIIGANGGNSRPVGGLDPTNTAKQTTLVTDFVVSQGGEYFFSPSLSALENTIAA
ncbi:DyP-type peroxidase [Mycena kentingensis (nom. inval.)]|nr:DyP-type peroxidase [Mycena kentingensis (nom. inval.)]